MQYIQEIITLQDVHHFIHPPRDLYSGHSPPGGGGRRFFPPIEKQGRIWRRTKKTEESDLLSAIVMELTHLLPLSLTLSLTHHLNNLMKWKIPLIMHIIMNAFFHFLFKLFKKNFKMWILRKILKNSGGPLRTLYNHF